ncbi:MAG: hypothetical protein WC906_03255 [Parcubacteria group bacterium]|jgi:hypothetical protein
MIKILNFKILIFSFIFVSVLAVLLFPAISYASPLVPCGRSDQGGTMCTLCDFIVGIKGLIDYGFTIMVFVALVMLVIAGVVYIVSAGNEGMMTTAKSLLKSVLIGFSIILGSWLMINTVMWVMGTRGSGDEGGALGIKVESWNKFKCK